jgi:AraC-like DNA-binding protein
MTMLLQTVPVLSIGPETTIAVRMVLALVASIEQCGASRTQIFEASGLDPELLLNLDGRVPSSDFHKLQEASLDLTCDPAFGLHWLKASPDSAFGPVSSLMMHAASMGAALTALGEFHCLLADDIGIEVSGDKSLITVSCRKLELAPPRLHRFVTETALSGMTKLIGAFKGEAYVKHVHFDYPAPDYSAEYEALFGERISFDQAHSELTFDRALLDAPALFDDADFHASVRSFATKRLTHLTKDSSYTNRVRAFLLDSGSPRGASMESVARALGVSQRSLRRRLADEGTAYDCLVADVYASIAKRLIVDEDRTIKEIAAELGFKDRRAFHRAFRRWTGTTPTSFRRVHKTQPPR